MTDETKAELYTILKGSFRARDEDGQRILLGPGDPIELSDEEAAPHVESGALIKGKPKDAAPGATEGVNVSALKGQVTRAKNQAEALEQDLLASQAANARLEGILAALKETHADAVEAATKAFDDAAAADAEKIKRAE